MCWGSVLLLCSTGQRATQSSGKSWALVPAYLGNKLTWEAAYPGVCRRLSVGMLHVPLPSVKGSQNSPQQVSPSCASKVGIHLLLKMCSGTRGTSIPNSVGKTECRAPSQIYRTRICILTRSPVISCMLKFLTNWFTKLNQL